MVLVRKGDKHSDTLGKSGAPVCCGRICGGGPPFYKGGPAADQYLTYIDLYIQAGGLVVLLGMFAAGADKGGLGAVMDEPAY